MSRVTPPIVTNTCRAKTLDRPTASSVPERVAAGQPVRRPRSTRIAEQHEAAPASSGQSQFLAEGPLEMKSVWQGDELGVALAESRCRTAAGQAEKVLAPAGSPRR